MILYKTPFSRKDGINENFMYEFIGTQGMVNRNKND
jgi:hypothetical protein